MLKHDMTSIDPLVLREQLKREKNDDSAFRTFGRVDILSPPKRQSIDSSFELNKNKNEGVLGTRINYDGRSINIAQLDVPSNRNI